MTEEKDQFTDINASMSYSVPCLGDNVLKRAKLVRICGTKGCLRKVIVSKICSNGRVKYSCPEHGLRNINNMKWLEITGSTMLEFRKVGIP